MKGIGEKGAVNFLIEIGGDIKQFESHKKVIAMAGIDPAVYQSGKIDRKGKISKRGNRHQQTGDLDYGNEGHPI